MSQWNEDDAKKMLILDESQLLVCLGKQISSSRVRMIPLTQNKAMEYGRLWFDSKTDEIRNIICGNKQIRQLIINPGEDQVLLFLIADLIANLCTGVSPITVAALCIRKGIKGLCSSNWSEGT
jgi:hypothetical protein